MSKTTWPGAASALANSPEAAATWRLGPVRLGYIDYLNCLPVYYGIEQGVIDLPVAIKKGPPAVCNAMFRDGALDIAPISSIEAARQHPWCLVLPNLSISADGPVASILLFTRRPLEAVRTVALTSASATSVVLTKIILAERYRCRPAYTTMAPDLGAMLQAADAALIIGDDALLARAELAAGRFPGITAVDLGAEWKAMTGGPMVYGLWSVRRDFAERSPEGVRLVARLLQQSQAYGWQHRSDLVDEALRRRGLPRPVVETYFQLIRHDFGPAYRRAFRTFLEYAARLGELDAVPDLAVWEES